MMNKPDPNSEHKSEKESLSMASALSYITLVTEIGYIMVANIIAGFFIGMFLDRWLNTSYLFFFIFIVFGVISGMKRVYSRILRLGKRGGKHE